jgi:hypothetical protein
MGQQYTPGPWTTTQAGNDYEEITADGGRVIATTSTDDDKGEQKANARLIAAAPELVEALLGLSQGWGDWCECIDPKQPNHCYPCMARAALLHAGVTL